MLVVSGAASVHAGEEAWREVEAPADDAPGEADAGSTIAEAIDDAALAQWAKDNPDATALTLRDASAVTDYGPLTKLKDLATLCLYNADLPKLRDIGRIKALTRLELHHCTGYTSLKDLSKLKNLTTLRIVEGGQHHLADWKYLPKLKNLAELHLVNCTGLTDFTKVGALSKLTSLTIHANPNLTDITPLLRCGALVNLSLIGCERMTNLRALARLSRIDFIELPSRFEAYLEIVRQVTVRRPNTRVDFVD